MKITELTEGRMTHRQRLANALQRAGLDINTGTDVLRIFSDPLKNSVKHKFYGIGDKIPDDKKDAVEKELKKEYPNAEVSISYSVVVKAPK